jgi:alpha/beta superfamily hydrolase
MSIRKVTIGSDYDLEGILREKSTMRGVVVCHPHPLYGGDMYNNIVEAIEEGFSDKGLSTLRFNFRGVGGSGGSYDEKGGEVRDVLSALSFLRDSLAPNASIMLAGYSFGAWVCALAGAQVKESKIEGLFLVAYPFSFSTGEELKTFNGKIYLVGGILDQMAPVDDLLRLYKDLPMVEKYLKIVSTDHFFAGGEREIIEFIQESVETAHGQHFTVQNKQVRGR